MSKKRKIKASWPSVPWDKEHEEFTATFDFKAKGLDPITGHMRVIYSAAPDYFSWFIESNNSGTLDSGDRGLISGQATKSNTDSFYDRATRKPGRLIIKELNNDDLKAIIRSGNTKAVVEDFGGWTFSELWAVLSDL